MDVITTSIVLFSISCTLNTGESEWVDAENEITFLPVFFVPALAFLLGCPGGYK